MDGSGKALLNIVQGLSKKHDFQSYIVLPSLSCDLAKSLKEAGANCFELKIPRAIYPPFYKFKDIVLFPYFLIKLVFSSIISYKRLYKIVESVSPDIVHTNTGVIHLGFFVARKLKINHVWHIREFQDLDFGMKFFPSKRFFIRLLSSRNNTCIFVSETIREHFLPESSSIVIYDGVIDNSNLIPTICSKENYFLFVGNLGDGKGVMSAVSSFIRFTESNNKGFKLKIAGLGSNYGKIKQISMRYPQIELLGFRNDVADLMSRATALLAPSRSEGFGFITVEAMYNGCWVIGKDSAGIKEQFNNIVNVSGEEIGTRFMSDDELLEAMIDIASHNQTTLFNKLQQAQSIVSSLYSIDGNVRNIIKVYSSLSPCHIYVE